MKNKTSPLYLGALSAAIILAMAAAPAVAAGKQLPRQKVDPAISLSRADSAQGASRFIVKYRDGDRASIASTLGNRLQQAASKAGVAGNGRSALSVQPMRRLGTGADLVRVSRALDTVEAKRFMDQLRADPAVEYVQPDSMMQAYDFVPDDKYFQQLQWDFANSSVGINAPRAWDNSTGEGVVVAVLDTGYVDHQDLNANIIPGYDFINDPVVAGDGDGRDADAHDVGDYTDTRASSWHGTHVAGTVAAVTNNAVGVAGVAFNAKVQPVRVLGRGGGYTSDIADAITWASGGHVDGVPDNANPAEVINLSLGGQRRCSDDPTTQAAIDGAIDRGVTVVVAAGNDNMDASNFSPASCVGVIAVGASGVDGARSYFSNYGAPLALSAPGGNATSGDDPEDRWIWSLGNSGSTDPVASPAGDSLMGMIGTSQASPHVAGVVALMQAAAVSAGYPPLTPVQVKNILRASATPFTVTPPSNKPQGAGILNADAAVKLAMQEPSPEPPAQVLANRVPATGLTAAAGDSLLYQLSIPAGTRSFNVRTYGGSGDVSLYVSQGQTPTIDEHDRASERLGNNEAITITSPVAGDYYIRVTSKTAAFSGVSLMAVY
ncbi:S8 family peptidase [Pseudoxanthomonas dokdonensis]|uniref:Protease n=1 Tax=Pseudoxanthomonas dokdonensis TaxID=344882 RepID=A0A0R0CKT7_9GAMM|nr:S8 family peptidase [Pseudoxanthomonas dokdonensis]KRG70155.1 hypothetical protein ABB29_08030 [Pseudoxanthomonas dokdonensis]